MDLYECNDIIMKGYPSRKELSDFPLGEKLKQLDMMAWTTTARVIELKNDEPDMDKEALELKLIKENRMLQNESLGEIYRNHIKHVIKAINFLTTGQAGELVPKLKPTDPATRHFQDYMRSFLNSMSDETRAFLRFLALYHDIGKVIHRDRHPILGRHLLESLSDEETGEFKKILRGRDRNLFFTFVQLIGHHDLFGVLCTGEASLLVLVDVLRPKEAILICGCLVTLNLADIFGTLPVLTPRILGTVLSDWEFLHNLLHAQETFQGVVYRSEIEKKILMEAQSLENSTERLKRLIVTSIFMVKGYLNEDEKETLTKNVTNDVVLDALMNRLGPELLVFCYDFALVCKFDYTLKFINMLVSQWLEKKKNELGSNCSPDYIEVKGIAALIVEVLVRLVRNYRDLTRQCEGWPRRIGIELLGLTRSDVIAKRVIELLLSDRHTEGVNWIADEATAWYFI